jgi:hypothetical protein
MADLTLTFDDDFYQMAQDACFENYPPRQLMGFPPDPDYVEPTPEENLNNHLMNHIWEMVDYWRLTHTQKDAVAAMPALDRGKISIAKQVLPDPVQQIKP